LRFALVNEFDHYDRAILALLQANARTSLTELSKQIHLTAPAVTERVRKLEEAGVISGYRAQINLRKFGYSFEVFVQVTVDSHAALDAWADAHPEVLEISATTGNHCALLRIALTEPEHLQKLLAELGEIGKSSTSMVLSSRHFDRARVDGATLMR
jgi:Lrp/AsnC family transcriptional regulator, leucine-responsive regulatory protein